jgi:hypothetical protein
VKRVERFGLGLGLGDGSDIPAAREVEKAGEATAGVLDDDSLGGVEEEGS